MRGGDRSDKPNADPKRLSSRPIKLPAFEGLSLMNSAANGDGFIGASRQGSVATC